MLAYVFVVFAVLFRFLIPVFGSKEVTGLMGFAPLTAALLYFGARQPRARMWAPLAMLIAGDVALNVWVYHLPLGADQVVSWAFYCALMLFGGVLRENQVPLRVGGVALSSSVAFFLVSNFAVWAVWAMYPKTLAGLSACYIAGLPFFRNALIGDLAWTAVFFGAPALAAQFGLQAERVRAK
ncbi:MAG TPA: DUF6580 family putative transport protein [Terriglobales bacterium]|nr:DUF6580 family putative transport protein [Terriglobales bacterium]